MIASQWLWSESFWFIVAIVTIPLAFLYLKDSKDDLITIGFIILGFPIFWIVLWSLSEIVYRIGANL